MAEAHGRWGTLQFTFVLYALGWYFNEALIVGEANSMGLGVLQRLYSELDYTYQYFREARPDAKASPRTDRLGFFKTAESKLIPRLQWAINPIDMNSGARSTSKLHVRSPHLLEELRRYERRPRNKTADLLGTRDKDLVMGAEPGYHDDLVSAAAAAVTGWFDLARFEKPEPTFNGIPIKWVEKLADAPLIMRIERLSIDDLRTGCRYNNAAIDDLRRSHASAECTRPAADAL